MSSHVTWIKKLKYKFKGLLLHYLKRWKNAFWDKMDGSWGDFVESEIGQKVKDSGYGFTHLRNISNQRKQTLKT